MSALVHVLLQLPKVEQLLLQTNAIDDDSGSRLVSCLLHPECERINVLDLAYNKLSHLTILPMIRLLYQPTSLATPAHATLHTLSLAGNVDIGDVGAQALFGALTAESSSVRNLDITRCGITEKSAEALKTMLAENK